MQSRDGAELTKDVASKDVDSANQVLGSDVSVMNEVGEAVADEQEQASGAADMPVEQVNDIFFEFVALLLLKLQLCLSQKSMKCY